MLYWLQRLKPSTNQEDRKTCFLALVVLTSRALVLARACIAQSTFLFFLATGRGFNPS